MLNWVLYAPLSWTINEDNFLWGSIGHDTVKVQGMHTSLEIHISKK